MEQNQNELVLFESQDKGIKLSVPFNNETVWLSQRQMIELFERDQSVISKHIKNVFEEEEVEKERGCPRSCLRLQKGQPFFVKM